MKKAPSHEAAAAWLHRSVEDVYRVDRTRGVCTQRVEGHLCVLEFGHAGAISRAFT